VENEDGIYVEIGSQNNNKSKSRKECAEMKFLRKVKSCKKLKITRKNGIREELQRVPWN
jgi:hypothetical protein